MYGEVGLRQRFALEIQKFDRPDRDGLEQALGLVSELHRLDRRSREPYVNHLLRTAIRIITYYDVTDVDVSCGRAAARLGRGPPRGTGGQPPGDPTEAALAELAERFNPRVADLVRAVTNPPRVPGSTATSSTASTSRRASRRTRGPA
jgi:(p)ppGpp synthase/HD superfamily hydrolase